MTKTWESCGEAAAVLGDAGRQCRCGEIVAVIVMIGVVTRSRSGNTGTGEVTGRDRECVELVVMVVMVHGEMGWGKR